MMMMKVKEPVTIEDIQEQYPGCQHFRIGSSPDSTYDDIGYDVAESCRAMASGSEFRAKVFCFCYSDDVGSDGVSLDLLLDESGREKYLFLIPIDMGVSNV